MSDEIPVSEREAAEWALLDERLAALAVNRQWSPSAPPAPNWRMVEIPFCPELTGLPVRYLVTIDGTEETVRFLDEKERILTTAQFIDLLKAQGFLVFSPPEIKAVIAQAGILDVF
jgi:hypothetical protein